MESTKLAGLKPARVFYYFEQLCAIPHGSGNTKAISDYLVSFAKEHGLRYIQDSLNNVIIFQDGTCGMEGHAPVILQGHMDMVCEKDENCPINFETDGLDITHDGEFIFANGTTLGGDDGIAIAYALAILADTSIPHPPLEVVITVDEETGMYGAADIDLSMLKGRRLLNIDSEKEGIFTVSCAGGVTANLHVPMVKRPTYGPCIRLTVDGLTGGHSGVDIDKNRICANKVMANLLLRVKQVMPFAICSISGGTKDNAIARSCQVTAVMLGTDAEKINDVCAQLQEELQGCYDEPDLVIYGENVEALGANAISYQDTKKIIGMMINNPAGPLEWSPDIPGLVQTSQNMGIVRLADGFDLNISIRSCVDEQRDHRLALLKDDINKYGAELSVYGEYPAWEYRADSPLRDTMTAVYRRMFKKEPQVLAIHAGLECGLLSKKLPGLDCVSIGPDMKDIHTSREKLDIASTERTWNFLLEVLKAL